MRKPTHPNTDKIDDSQGDSVDETSQTDAKRNAAIAAFIGDNEPGEIPDP